MIFVSFPFRSTTPKPVSPIFLRAFPLSSVEGEFGVGEVVVLVDFGSLRQAPLTLCGWANSESVFLYGATVFLSGNFVTRAHSAGSFASWVELLAAELFKPESKFILCSTTAWPRREGC